MNKLYNGNQEPEILEENKEATTQPSDERYYEFIDEYGVIHRKKVGHLYDVGDDAWY